MPPVLHQPTYSGPIDYAKAEEIEQVFPRFLGRYAWDDSIFSPDEKRKASLWETNLYRSEAADLLPRDSLVLYPDYGQSVFVEEKEYWPRPRYYYPVFLVNKTAKTRAVFGKDSHVFGIQEALDRKGNWRPIESEGLDFCGNGRWVFSLRPGECMPILFPKYSGDFKTKLRVRVENATSLFISPPFEGTIDERKFRIEKNRWQYLRFVRNRNWEIQGRFYGAVPAGSDDAGIRRMKQWLDSNLFLNPDTLVEGIALGRELAASTLFSRIRYPRADSVYCFHSADRRQVLEVEIQMEEEGRLARVKGLSVRPSEPGEIGYPKTSAPFFRTGHGFRLGMPRDALHKKIGSDYALWGSDPDTTILFEVQKEYDTRNGLLQRLGTSQIQAYYRIAGGRIVRIEYSAL